MIFLPFRSAGRPGRSRILPAFCLAILAAGISGSLAFASSGPGAGGSMPGLVPNPAPAPAQAELPSWDQLHAAIVATEEVQAADAAHRQANADWLAVGRAEGWSTPAAVTAQATADAASADFHAIWDATATVVFGSLRQKGHSLQALQAKYGDKVPEGLE